MKKIKVWNYTYWPINARIWWFKNAFIQIWSFCSIAPEVQFICGMDHSTKQVLTYVIWTIGIKDTKKWKEAWCLENVYKWPIVIDDDVWIWTWAKIMSWVHVWQWAVICAWSIVTKDIPPYAIAWWIPAKVLKYRFWEDMIKELLKINYSTLHVEDLLKLYPEIIKENFNINYILKSLNNKEFTNLK